jgi:hypothetical protein
MLAWLAHDAYQHLAARATRGGLSCWWVGIVPVPQNVSTARLGRTEASPRRPVLIVPKGARDGAASKPNVRPGIAALRHGLCGGGRERRASADARRRARDYAKRRKQRRTLRPALAWRDRLGTGSIVRTAGGGTRKRTASSASMTAKRRAVEARKVAPAPFSGRCAGGMKLRLGAGARLERRPQWCGFGLSRAPAHPHLPLVGLLQLLRV